MRIVSLTVLAILLVVAATNSWSAQSTYELVVAGKSCEASETTQNIDCDYKVGKGLHFGVAGIGLPDAGVTVYSSSFDGDFYITYGLLHGCVIVKRGPDSISSGVIDGPGSMLDFAFVSPRNGKIYETW